MRIMLNNEIFKENVIKLSYRIINNLLYFNNNEKDLRFYISSIMKIKVFKLTYDEIRHFNYARIYKQIIKKNYIFKMIIKLYKFIRYYLYY